MVIDRQTIQETYKLNDIYVIKNDGIREKFSYEKLIKEGSINSIKQGKKIIIPKVCLVDFLLDQKNYQILSPVVPNNHWTCDGCCGSVGVAQESKVKNNKKGA